MDSFEANKIFGALLGTIFVLFGGSLLAEGIFHSEAPETPGYIIEAAVEEGGGAAEVEAVPIATLLQAADAEAGAAEFRRCQSCHNAEEGGANLVGPHLWGVVDRPIAGEEGFSYSGALSEFSQGGSVVWDYEHLNGFLLNPRSYVPGTAMGFAGLANDEARANLIAYLRTLSDSPAPLPEAPAETAEAPADGEAPAEGEAPAAEGETPAAEGATPPVTAPGTTTDDAGGAATQAPATTDTATGAAEANPDPANTPATGDNATSAPPEAETPGADAAPAESDAATDAATDTAPAAEEEAPAAEQPAPEPAAPAAPAAPADGAAAPQ